MWHSSRRTLKRKGAVCRSMPGGGLAVNALEYVWRADRRRNRMENKDIKKIEGQTI